MNKEKFEVKEKELEEVTGGVEQVEEARPGVFQESPKFTQAPELPATNLAQSAYDNMFEVPTSPEQYEIHIYK